MGKPRQTWTVEQKLTIILAALREEQRIAALARQHGVSEQQIYRWKTQFLEGGRQALGRAKTPREEVRQPLVRQAALEPPTDRYRRLSYVRRARGLHIGRERVRRLLAGGSSRHGCLTTSDVS